MDNSSHLGNITRRVPEWRSGGRPSPRADYLCLTDARSCLIILQANRFLADKKMRRRSLRTVAHEQETIQAPPNGRAGRESAPHVVEPKAGGAGLVRRTCGEAGTV